MNDVKCGNLTISQALASVTLASFKPPDAALSLVPPAPRDDLSGGWPQEDVAAATDYTLLDPPHVTNTATAGQLPSAAAIIEIDSEASTSSAAAMADGGDFELSADAAGLDAVGSDGELGHAAAAQAVVESGQAAQTIADLQPRSPPLASLAAAVPCFSPATGRRVGGTGGIKASDIRMPDETRIAVMNNVRDGSMTIDEALAFIASTEALLAQPLQTSGGSGIGSSGAGTTGTGTDSTTVTHISLSPMVPVPAAEPAFVPTKRVVMHSYTYRDRSKVVLVPETLEELLLVASQALDMSCGLEPPVPCCKAPWSTRALSHLACP